MENQGEGRRKKITILWQHSPQVHQHARYAKTKMDASERVWYSASLYLEELRYQPLIPLRERRVTALFTTRATRPAPSSLALLPSCVSSSSSSSTSSRFLFPWPSSPSLTGCLIRRAIARVRIDPPSCSRACFFLSRASWTHITRREPMYEVTDLWEEILLLPQEPGVPELESSISCYFAFIWNVNWCFFQFFIILDMLTSVNWRRNYESILKLLNDEEGVNDFVGILLNIIKQLAQRLM